MSNLEFLNFLIDKAISRINTVLPAKITKYDFKTRKCSVKPLLNYISQDGQEIELPIINNVPLKTISSGGAIINLPVSIGDFVEIRFCQRSLEEWLSNGKQVTPDDPRTHDLTDAFASYGLNPFNVISPASNNEDVEIIYAGKTIALKKNGDIIINGNNVNITATSVNIEANQANIKSTDIKLGDNATQGVARLGDQVIVGGVSGKITSASSITKSL